MRFHNHMPSKGYEMLQCIDNGNQWEIFHEMDGSPRAQNWTPIRVRRVRITNRDAFRPSDSPYFATDTLVFRRSAVDALRDILEAHGELLPLIDEGGVELYAYNPRALDAFDHERTPGRRDEHGRIESTNKHVFIPSVLEGVDIFKEACPRGGGIYLSERFLQRWKKAKLKGLDFYLVWDSDLPPDQQPNVMTAKPVKMSSIR